MEDDIHTHATITLPRKSLKMHAAKLWKHRGVFFKYATATFLGLIAFYEGVVKVFSTNEAALTNWWLVVLITLFVSFWKTISSYYNDIPKLIHGDRIAKKIYFFQKEGWHLLIMHRLINKKVLQLKGNSRRLMENGRFIPSRVYKEDEFIAWTKSKFSQIGKLLESANVTVNKRLVQEIESFKSENDLHHLETGIVELYQLLGDIAWYERSLRLVEAPEKYKQLQGYMYGWTETIIVGIEKMNTFLERVGNGERPGKDEALELVHEYEWTKSFSDYVSVMDRVRNQPKE